MIIPNVWKKQMFQTTNQWMNMDEYGWIWTVDEYEYGWIWEI